MSIKPKKVRLGKGALTHQDERRLLARVWFLGAVHHVEPAVLRDLRDEFSPANAGDALSPRGNLSAWAARWGLAVPWIMDAANRTLAAWYLLPHLLEVDPPRWQHYGEHALFYAPPDAQRLAPDLGVVWDRMLETRGEARERLLRAAEAAITRALDEVAAQEPGDEWAMTVAVRPEVFEWVVRRVVRRERPSEIYARDPRANYDTPDGVRRAIDRLARVLELPLPDLD